MACVLAARSLELTFAGGKKALADINLEIGESELVVVAGKNGAGKTLLAKCLAGLIEPTRGEVSFRGRRLSEGGGSPATRVAYVFQDARLQVLGDTLLDDVIFGLAATGTAPLEAPALAKAALASVGLEGREGELPSQLSGGELRRLAIASVLALDPAVLILDEPFANLDWASIDSVLRVILACRARARTLLVLTHELDKLLGMADRLVILDEGRIAVDGEPAAALREGVEHFGLRDPLRHHDSLADLLWLKPGR